MRRYGIRSKVKKRFKVTTYSKHGLPVADNLLRRGEIRVHRPDQMWVSDITYIRSREEWLYVCIIMDLYSWSIVGWSMEDRLTKEVLKSLYMACMRRKPGRGVIFHYGWGSQYASHALNAALMKKGFIASMSGKGNCYDNAHAESFFHTMKVEEVYGNVYKSRHEAKLNIFEYIEVFYNRIRKHSQLGYQSPYQFENQKRSYNVA